MVLTRLFGVRFAVGKKKQFTIENNLIICLCIFRYGGRSKCTQKKLLKIIKRSQQMMNSVAFYAHRGWCSSEIIFSMLILNEPMGKIRASESFALECYC